MSMSICRDLGKGSSPNEIQHGLWLRRCSYKVTKAGTRPTGWPTAGLVVYTVHLLADFLKHNCLQERDCLPMKSTALVTSASFPKHHTVCSCSSRSNAL